MSKSKSAPKVQNTKAQKSVDQISKRVQLHLGKQTARRLGVHAALKGVKASHLADEVLSKWLARWGEGKELFPAPLDIEDRLDPTLGVNLTAAE